MLRSASIICLTSGLLASVLLGNASPVGAVELKAAAPAISLGHAPVGDLTSLPAAKPWRLGDPVRPEPALRAQVAGLAARGVPLDQRALVAPSGPSLLQPLLVKAGQGFTGTLPPATVGAVGRGYFIQAVNAYDFATGGSGAQIVIYDKAGRRLAGPISLNSLWPNPSDSCASGGGEGIVVYDAAADRFIISQAAAASTAFSVSMSPRPATRPRAAFTPISFRPRGSPGTPRSRSGGICTSSPATNSSRPSTHSSARPC